MCARPGTTFVKRQKEHARLEKRRAKAERKQQRKAEKLAAVAQPDSINPALPADSQNEETP